MSNKPSHKKVFVFGGIAATIMFAFCFAMVPLYSLICKATGISQPIKGSGLLTAVSAETKEKPDLSRTITVQFVAVNHNGMTWEFYPKTKTIQVHPGENNKVFFYVKNTTGHPMTVQAIPSMTPADALAHFHKIICFCFNQQSLNAYESKDMPMIFRIDKELPENIHVITLAYTLFDVTPKEARKE